MKSLLKPIALNETSYSVNLLHKALTALEVPVSKKEVTLNRAGQDTLNQVRKLQEKMNLDIDESLLLNDATTIAFVELMAKRGLLDASRSFIVSGAVRFQNGAVKKRQKLLAFDLDLRGVSVYRTINNLVEIRKNGGFEFLGESQTDIQGNYQITFYDWQYGQAERKKADVVVYAIEEEKIIGCSRMVNSEDYSDKGLVRDLDIIITQEDKRTEYEVLMNTLNGFLKESETSLGEIAISQDQLIFTAGELDIDLSCLNIAAEAELLAQGEEIKISHELLYGIGRQDIRLSWDALYKQKEEWLREAIDKSVHDNIIQAFGKRQIAAFIKAVNEISVEFMLQDEDGNNSNSLNIMLKNALPLKIQRISFANALRNFKGNNYREFWDKYLPEQPQFKEKPELITALLFTQQLTLLSGNHQTLVNELQVNRKLTSTNQLVDLEKKDWLELISKTGVPDSIKGKNDKEKAERYANMLQSLCNASFPTQRIATMVEKNELSIEKNRVSEHINTFLDQNNNFDFAGSRVHDFKKELKKAAGKDYEEVRRELLKIQRVFQVSTKPEVMSKLLENNLHSARTIATIPRKSFVKTYAKILGSEEDAFAVHQRASHLSTQAEMTAMHLMEYSHGLLPKATMDSEEYKMLHWLALVIT